MNVGSLWVRGGRLLLLELFVPLWTWTSHFTSLGLGSTQMSRGERSTASGVAAL